MNNLIDELIHNVNNDIERDTIETARNFKEVQETKRISNNIKTALIN